MKEFKDLQPGEHIHYISPETLKVVSPQIKSVTGDPKIRTHVIITYFKIGDQQTEDKAKDAMKGSNPLIAENIKLHDLPTASISIPGKADFALANSGKFPVPFSPSKELLEKWMNPTT